MSTKTSKSVAVVIPPKKPRKPTKKFTAGDKKLLKLLAGCYVDHILGERDNSSMSMYLYREPEIEAVRGNLAIPAYMLSQKICLNIGRGNVHGWLTVSGLPPGKPRAGAAVKITAKHTPKFTEAVKTAYVERMHERAGDWWSRRAWTQYYRCDSLRREIAKLTEQLYDKSVERYPTNPQKNARTRAIAAAWNLDEQKLAAITTKTAELMEAARLFHDFRQRYSDAYANWKPPSDKKLLAILVAHKLIGEEK